MQKKCILCCLKLDNMHNVSEEDFKAINCLPVDQSAHKTLNATVFDVSIMCALIRSKKSLSMPHKIEQI